jgi:ABC-type antimicrobial peptide transport system permease subunit
VNHDFEQLNDSGEFARSEVAQKFMGFARPGDVVRLVVRQGMELAAIGMTAGLIGAVALTRLMASLLFGVAPTDPLTFSAIAVILAGAALLATAIPALRAARLDPLIALRQE